MKLWVDDIRAEPDGWSWAKTAAEAKMYLLTYTVTHASLDHDLGDGCERCWAEDEDPNEVRQRSEFCEGPGKCRCECHEDGTSLVRWMADNEVWPERKPLVHSANPAGADRMRAIIECSFRPGK